MNLERVGGIGCVSMTSSSNMKLVIPKTLAEPAGIPWGDISMWRELDWERYLRAYLIGSYEDMRRNNVLPDIEDDDLYKMTSDNVANTLSDIALDNGATSALGERFTALDIYDKPIGWNYRVVFTIPKKKTQFVQWFHLFR